MSDAKEIHGWTAVPRDPAVLLEDVKTSELKPLVVDDIQLPDSPLAKEVLAYAKKELSEQTFNHSMRVFYYGRAIQTLHFPHWSLSPETYLLTSLLHDIGTTPSNLASTHLSFEYHGGFIALSLLQNPPNQASKPQAEAVAEAVIRHQDLDGTTGKITALGGLIQLATVFDNTGKHAELLHQTTIENVIQKYNRQGWSTCFADTIGREVEIKPWAHSTALGEGFVAAVMGNKVGGRWD